MSSMTWANRRIWIDGRISTRSRPRAFEQPVDSHTLAWRFTETLLSCRYQDILIYIPVNLISLYLQVYLHSNDMAPFLDMCLERFGANCILDYAANLWFQISVTYSYWRIRAPCRKKNERKKETCLSSIGGWDMLPALETTLTPHSATILKGKSALRFYLVL